MKTILCVWIAASLPVGILIGKAIFRAAGIPAITSPVIRMRRFLPTSPDVE